jgi:anti-sigma factor RsiW
VSGHLGSWVSPLADGQLDPATTEAALAHVAVCPRCARELEAARAARAALLRARDVPPAPDLADRLLRLSASIPPAEDDPLRRPARATGWEAPDAWRVTITGDLADRRRRTRRLLAAGAGGAGVLGLALFALGQAPVVTPDSSRTAALALLSHAGDESATVVADGSDGEPATATAAAWLADHGWVAPERLPEGYDVTSVRVVGTDPDAIELDLEGPEGTAVVREQVGRLEAAGQADAGRVTVLSRDPWHVAWQAGDVALEVVGDVPDDVLADLVAAFPGDGYDAGVLPRISRGWTTVTGAIWRP